MISLTSKNKKRGELNYVVGLNIIWKRPVGWAYPADPFDCAQGDSVALGALGDC